MMHNDHNTNAMTRRDFVRGAGTILAVPMFAGAALSSQARAQGAANAADEIRIGLIGCGGRGTGAAAQALNASPNNVLVAMGDMFEDKLAESLKNLKDNFGDAASTKIRVDKSKQFLGFDAFQKVMATDVDVVILTTPPGFRPQHLKAAVEAGKHVFCEKPVAVDAPGIRSVIASAELSKKKNLALMCGFCWRYHDGMRATFDKINSGAIGDVISVHSTYLTSSLAKRPRQANWTDMEFQLRNWWHFTWLSGDHLVEQAVHSVDRLAWATGDKTPARCIALGGRIARTGPESGNVYDHFTVTYEYDDGTRAFLTARQIDNTPFDNEDYIYGTKGSAQVDGWKPLYEIKDSAGNVTWNYDGPNDDMYQHEHNELFKSIRSGGASSGGNSGGGGTLINDGPWMAHSVMMAIMGRMAAYTGQTITWDQAMNSQEDLTPKTIALGPIATPEVAVPGKTQFV